MHESPYLKIAFQGSESSILAGVSLAENMLCMQNNHLDCLLIGRLDMDANTFERLRGDKLMYVKHQRSYDI